MDDKIDLVITWVDGNDPEWQKERNHYAEAEHKDMSNNSSRYRDWGTLRYFFRGVEEYAPWVNNVFFVTWGHLPDWLNVNHPKLIIVKHSDFIPSEYLPTFSSNVIEFYFHRIPGLSEKFVYFNDDMFLLDDVKPERFFKDGLPCDIGGMTTNIHSGIFGANVLLSKTAINEHFNKWEVIKKNPSKWFNIAYIKQSLLNVLCTMIRKDEFTGFINPHIAQGYLLKSYHGVWKHCSKEILRTSINRFRDYRDVAPWLIRYWQLASGDFYPINTQKDGQYYLISDDNISEIVDCIIKRKKKLICLNDSNVITQFEVAKSRILESFEKILPKKSTYESF